jgi:hypothetical protein
MCVFVVAPELPEIISPLELVDPVRVKLKLLKSSKKVSLADALAEASEEEELLLLPVSPCTVPGMVHEIMAEACNKCRRAILRALPGGRRWLLARREGPK